MRSGEPCCSVSNTPVAGQTWGRTPVFRLRHRDEAGRGKPGGKTRGQTGRTPVFRLRHRDEAGLAGIGCRLFGASSLSWSERAQHCLFQSSHEFRRSERSTGVRGSTQRTHIGCRFLVGKKATPFDHRPSLPPSFHVQHRLGDGNATVPRCARPLPHFRRRHHPRAHRIQLDIAESCPHMRFVQRTGIESALPHVPAGRLARIPIRGVASMSLFERLR
jgi:hypothetical protein